MMIRNKREGARKLLREAQRLYEDRLAKGEIDATKSKIKYVSEIKKELQKNEKLTIVLELND